ncbi:hypothetical protein IC582_012700 [Cucumis melo]|uniref:Ferredoxin n=2 Tax=Cucumis melo TaxID=3656 RepID=A0A1S3AX36_CUCME|nr:ferredoxin C 1, chloroplastic [Cucumis melo]
MLELRTLSLHQRPRMVTTSQITSFSNSSLSREKKTMATLHFVPSAFSLPKQKQPIKLSSVKPTTHISCSRRRLVVRSYKVVIEHEGQTTELEVDPDESILSSALDNGLEIPHDCKLGVCMTCPARLVSGTVDQSEGMLSDDVVEQGYSLLCVAYPRSDCHIKTIPEEELLALQLATAND